MICTLWTPFQAERDWKKIIPRDSLNSPLIYILFSMVETPYVLLAANSWELLEECASIRWLYVELETHVIGT